MVPANLESEGNAIHSEDRATDQFRHLLWDHDAIRGQVPSVNAVCPGALWRLQRSGLPDVPPRLSGNCRPGLAFLIPLFVCNIRMPEIDVRWKLLHHDKVAQLPILRTALLHKGKVVQQQALTHHRLPYLLLLLASEKSRSMHKKPVRVLSFSCLFAHDLENS